MPANTNIWNINLRESTVHTHMQILLHAASQQHAVDISIHICTVWVYTRSYADSLYLPSPHSLLLFSFHLVCKLYFSLIFMSFSFSLSCVDSYVRSCFFSYSFGRYKYTPLYFLVSVLKPHTHTLTHALYTCYICMLNYTHIAI